MATTTATRSETIHRRPPKDDLGWPSRRQGPEGGGHRRDLHALRRPHHRHLRRLHRRGHQGHRRASRAGRRARRRRLCARHRAPRLRGRHRRPGHDRRHHRRRQRVPRGEPDAADRRPGRAQPAQAWARSRTCRTSTSCRRSRSSPRTSCTTERVADMVSMAFREALPRRPRPLVPRDRPRHPRRARPDRGGGHPRGRPLPRVDQEHRRPRLRRPSRRHPVQGGAALRAARQPGLDRRAASDAAIEFARELNIPAFMNGAARGTLPPGRPAPLPPDAPLRVQQRRRDPDRGHAVRLPHGLRQAPAPGGDRRPDRHGLPHRRQEPRHRPRPRRRPRRDPVRGHQGGVGPSTKSADTASPGSRRCATEENAPQGGAPAAPHARRRPDPPAAARARDQRVPRRGLDLHRRRRRRRDVLRRRRAAEGAGPVDGPGPAGHPRRRRAVRDGREDAPARTARSSACSATARSASPAGTSRRWSASTCRSSASSATTPT